MAESLPPQIFVVENFVIEAYTSITEVPYATISEQRGKATDQEREDELYGRCRICVMNKNENLLLCDDCDRAFHMSCLVPIIRDIPKGEWLCPKCESEREHHYHTCAAAVIKLRNVLLDIESRPSLPLKLQLKLLDMPPPNVRFTRANDVPQAAPPDTITPSLAEGAGSMHRTVSRRHRLQRFPPKHRKKMQRSQEQTQKQQQKATATQQRSALRDGNAIVFKKVDQSICKKHLRGLVHFTDDLQPVADRLHDAAMPGRLQHVRECLAHAGRDGASAAQSVTLLDLQAVKRLRGVPDARRAEVHAPTTLRQPPPAPHAGKQVVLDAGVRSLA